VKIIDKILQDKKLLAVLIDPDKAEYQHIEKICANANQGFIDLLFVGGSITSVYVDNLVEQIKEMTNVPVVLFPGHPSQVSLKADAILFLSLISGRNPDFLIGHHIYVSKLLKNNPIEVIPTGYILVESQNTTSVEYISNTKPIPADKADIVVSTALAGELLGMKLIYLEGGSGASRSINSDLIKNLKAELSIPLIVGGGIKTIEDMQTYAQSGANVVVIGTLFEKNEDLIPKFYKKLQEC